MPREIQEPVTVPVDEDRGTKTTHPAFGQVSVSRVQGTANLYGSDFTHHHFVVVEVHTSELHRNLARDWNFARETILQFAMSEAQWATFVSSFGMGGGVPCTLEYREGKPIPMLPERKTYQTYRDEAMELYGEQVAGLEKLLEQVTESTGKMTKKAQAEVLGPIKDAIAMLKNGLPFIQSSFDEHIETTIERGKVEVHAYADNLVRRAGLESLGVQPPALPAPDKK